jgi:pimeloyl-ACP methyl ester carboxylesterase
MVFSWVAAVVLLALAGLTYEAYADAEAAREFPPPGTLVDIGGRRLHLVCVGRDDPMEPTVMFLSSGWGNSMSSSKARERLGTRTRVCSYDRLGHGWSDAAPAVTTIAGTASDLGVLQDRAMIRSPLVLVASSIGGLTAEMFARRYPERVAGVVFVDAANSLVVPRLAEWSGRITVAACTVGMLSRFGVIRLLDPFELGAASESDRRSTAITYGAKTWTAICSMARGLQDTRKEFEQAPALATELPITALSASSARQFMPPFVERVYDTSAARAELEEAHRTFAKRPHGTWKKIPNSSHLIADSQPDAVADAVFDLLDQLRGTPTSEATPEAR